MKAAPFGDAREIKHLKSFFYVPHFYDVFSRIGMPGDNAWAESFFATLKKNV